MQQCSGGEYMKIRLYVLKNIKKYTAIVKGSIVGLIVVNLMSVPISLISPKFFQILVDEVMWGRKIESFGIVAIGLLSVYLLRFVCDGMSLYLSNRVLNIFTFNMRKDIFDKHNIKMWENTEEFYETLKKLKKNTRLL